MAKNKLVNCIHEIQVWCASLRLKLNGSKTELIWFDMNTCMHAYEFTVCIFMSVRI